MKLSSNGALNVVLNYIKANVDTQATVSRKTGKPIIHYTVPNGKVHITSSGKESAYKVVRKLDMDEAVRICEDLDWTHDNMGA